MLADFGNPDVPSEDESEPEEDHTEGDEAQPDDQEDQGEGEHTEGAEDPEPPHDWGTMPRAVEESVAEASGSPPGEFDHLPDDGEAEGPKQDL